MKQYLTKILIVGMVVVSNGCKQACEIDADCDDGVYCNGPEKCVSDFCFPGFGCSADEHCEPSSDFALPCDGLSLLLPADKVCDEETGCLIGSECETDADCEGISNAVGEAVCAGACQSGFCAPCGQDCVSNEDCYCYFSELCEIGYCTGSLRQEYTVGELDFMSCAEECASSSDRIATYSTGSSMEDIGLCRCACDNLSNSFVICPNPFTECDAICDAAGWENSGNDQFGDPPRSGCCYCSE